jgi:hypothetical protein
MKIINLNKKIRHKYYERAVHGLLSYIGVVFDRQMKIFL